MSKSRITNVEKMQEFKARLSALMREFDASFSVGFSGDTHGIDEEWFEIHIGGDHDTIDTSYDIVSAERVEGSIGTEVLYVPPVPPPYVDPYTVFPVGTEVQYKECYLKTLHPYWLKTRKDQRGIVVPRSGTGLHPANKNYVYVLWAGDRRHGHTLNQIELAP